MLIGLPFGLRKTVMPLQRNLLLCDKNTTDHIQDQEDPSSKLVPQITEDMLHAKYQDKALNILKFYSSDVVINLIRRGQLRYWGNRHVTPNVSTKL